MKIKREFSDLLKICIINVFILGGCFWASLDPGIKPVGYIVLLGIYYFYLLSIKDDRRIVLFQATMIFLSIFVVEVPFHYLKITSPLELFYVIDGISLVLFIKIIINRKVYKNLLVDFFIQICLIIVVIGFVITLVNNNSVLDLLNTLRIYLRFLPVYIVLSRNEFNFKKYYKPIYILNILAFIGLVVLNVHRDLRTGIFGIVGGSTFQIFVSIAVVYLLIKYFYKEGSFFKFIIITIITLAMFAIAEMKSYLFIMVAICGLIILLINSKLIKKTVIVASLIVLFFAGINLMAQIYPNFAYLLNYDKIVENVEDYIFGNSNELVYQKGRFEATTYITDREYEGLFDEFFGLGIGQSMSPENQFYYTDAAGRQDIVDFPRSEIFSKYTANLGYHLSSFAIIFIDGGYLAVAICISIIILWIKRGTYVLKRGENTDIKFFGAMGIFIAIAAIYSCGYSTALRSRGYTFFAMLILGTLQYYNRQIKINKSNE